MADELRGKLAGLPGLEVIARGSSSQYQGSGKTPAEIAAELGVRYLLTGTVRWEKGVKRSRVRVSPELIEASTGVTRWPQPFDAAFTDVFAVQAEHRGPGRGRAAPGARGLDAGQAHRARRPATSTRTRTISGAASSARARSTPRCFAPPSPSCSEAVRLDPRFVAAWAELSQVQMDAFRHGGLMVADAEAARASLERAKALAPDFA